MASGVIRTLALNFVARTSGLTKGLNKAKRTISGFVSSVTNLGGRLTAIAGLLGATISVAGTVALIKSQMSAVDALAKTSDQLGITTQDLAAFQLQGELAGVGAEAFTKGIRTMVRSIADAGSGVKEAKTALAAIGLDPKRLQAQSVKNAYLDVADAISKVTNAQQRLDIATQVFGRGSQGMISMFLDGRGGFTKAATDANAFGLAISRIDAAKVEQANDAMTMAGNVIAGIARLAAVKFSPAIEALATGFVNWASSGTNAVDAVNAAFRGTVGVVKIVAGTIQGLSDLSQRLLVTFLGIRNGVAWLSGGTSKDMQAELERASITLERMESAPRWVDQIDEALRQADIASTKTAIKTAEARGADSDESLTLLRQIARNTRTTADQGADVVDF